MFGFDDANAWTRFPFREAYPVRRDESDYRDSVEEQHAHRDAQVVRGRGARLHGAGPVSSRAQPQRSAQLRYLVQCGQEFGLDRAQMNRRFRDERAQGRMPDARMLCADLSQQVPELPDSMHLVSRVTGGPELTMQIRGTLMAFNYANVFRVYHRQVTMQYGLTMARQEFFHQAVTRRLSPTISFEAV